MGGMKTKGITLTAAQQLTLDTFCAAVSYAAELVDAHTAVESAVIFLRAEAMAQDGKPVRSRSLRGVRHAYPPTRRSR